MASIYEIDRDILSCIDLETGEVIDIDKLNELQIERNRKIENIACWIKNLIGDANEIKAEREALEQRETAYRKKAEQLKAYLSEILQGEKFTAPRCAVTFRKSERIEIPDETAVPKKYLVIKTQPDKKAIKEAIKAGIKVRGCSILATSNIQIK